MKKSILSALANLILFAVSVYGTGELDRTFSDDGIRIVDMDLFDMKEEGSEMALDDNGRVVLTGEYHIGGSRANIGLGAVRIMPDASYDNSFGNGGKVTFNEYKRGYSVYILPDGDMLMTMLFQPGGGNTQRFKCMRLNNNGKIDKDFGQDGVSTLPIGRGTANSVTVDSKGRIVLGGLVPGSSNFDMNVARLDPDGTPDSSFGKNGSFQIIPPAQPFGAQDKPYNIVVDSDDKIILGGFARSKERNRGDPALAKVTEDGELDEAFGEDGMVFLPYKNNDFADALFDVILDSQERIVGAGYSYTKNGIDAVVVRVTPEGKPDKSFGDNGFVHIDFGDNFDKAYALALQSDGKILTGGYSKKGGWVARVTSNGELDKSFADKGIFMFGTSGDAEYFESVKSIVMNNDGKTAYIAGSNNGSALARMIISETPLPNANLYAITKANSPPLSKGLYDLRGRLANPENFKPKVGNSFSNSGPDEAEGFKILFAR